MATMMDDKYVGYSDYNLHYRLTRARRAYKKRMKQGGTGDGPWNGQKKQKEDEKEEEQVVEQENKVEETSTPVQVQVAVAVKLTLQEEQEEEEEEQQQKVEDQREEEAQVEKERVQAEEDRIDEGPNVPMGEEEVSPMELGEEVQQAVAEQNVEDASKQVEQDKQQEEKEADGEEEEEEDFDADFSFNPFNVVAPLSPLASSPARSQCKSPGKQSAASPTPEMPPPASQRSRSPSPFSEVEEGGAGGRRKRGTPKSGLARPLP